ncbi:MAG: sulfatase-like hydrolase/transferase [Lacipirellulaceae bacterium]
MSVPNLLLIVIDGWRASSLGAYGNSGLPTPNCDKLASESLLIDHLLCDSVELPDFYDSLWNAKHSLQNHSDEYSILNRLADKGYRTSLYTDEPWLAEAATNLPLEQLSFLDLERTKAASSVAETSCGELFAIAGEQLAKSRGNDPRIAWIHARGFHGPWDAPMEYRQQRLVEGDPPPLDFVTPPQFIESDDPDELFQYRTAYEAQMAVLDECLGDFFAAAYSTIAESTLMVLAGSRGFALGEHGTLGTDARPLYGELLHVPCLLLAPNIDQPIPRFSGLTQPMDLGATICDSMQLDVDSASKDGRSLLPMIANDADNWRQWILSGSGSGSESALRTPAWLMRTSEGTSELFVKPDDRWESNEVANRCPEVLAAMQALQTQLSKGEEAGIELTEEERALLLIGPNS